MSRPRTSALALLTIAAAGAALFSSPAAAAAAVPDWHVNAANVASANFARDDHRDWTLYGASHAFVSTDAATAGGLAGGVGDNLAGFAYETAIGAARPLDGRLAGEVKYHYVGAAADRFGAVAQQQLGGDYQPSAVTIGFGYRFGR